MAEFRDNESFRRGFNLFSIKPYRADRADVVSVKTVVQAICVNLGNNRSVGMTKRATDFKSFSAHNRATRAGAIVLSRFRAVCMRSNVFRVNYLSGEIVTEFFNYEFSLSGSFFSCRKPYGANGAYVVSFQTVVQAICVNLGNDRAVAVAERTADFKRFGAGNRATRAGAIVLSRFRAVCVRSEIFRVNHLSGKVMAEFRDNESFRRGFNLFSIKPYRADRADVVSVKTVVQAICVNLGNNRSVGMTKRATDFKSFSAHNRATRAGAIVLSRFRAVCMRSNVFRVNYLSGEIVTEFCNNESFCRGFYLFGVKPYGASGTDIVSVKTVVQTICVNLSNERAVTVTESRTVFKGFFSRQFTTRTRAIVDGFIHAVCRAYQISGFGNLSSKVVAEFSYDDVGYDCIVDIEVLTASGAGTIFNITVFRTGGILFQSPITEDVRSRSAYFESLFVL